MSTRTPVPLRRARRSFQRRYRRAWIERQLGMRYAAALALVHRAGARLRNLDDREVVRVARQQQERERASRVARSLAMQTLASSVQRSERWVRAALAALGLELDALPIEELRALAAKREAARRAKIGEARALSSARHRL
jgi:hypothetical protein